MICWIQLSVYMLDGDACRHRHTVDPHARFRTANDGSILWPTLSQRQLAALHLVLIFSSPWLGRGISAFAIEADSDLGPVMCGDWRTVPHLQAASCRAWDQLA
jgi:hypothetical protein